MIVRQPVTSIEVIQTLTAPRQTVHSLMIAHSLQKSEGDTGTDGWPKSPSPYQHRAPASGVMRFISGWIVAVPLRFFRL
jgi:hypothetical protein